MSQIVAGEVIFKGELAEAVLVELVKEICGGFG